MRTRRFLAAVALPLLLATGCGGDSDTTADDPTPASSEPDTASPSPSESAAPAGPACADVWVEGGMLPAAYAGCVADGALVEPEALSCSSGQTIVRYAEQYYGVLGGKIKFAENLAQDPDYRHSVSICRG
ncbi:hypothetical protein LRP67_08720 [Nocardioides sp. cx-169]|uniref:hypothetical protein n=1 Tax=Nocardioides sp. cx-169 TaxID=2899080 RepID=UPI001E2CF142|nr:hypothetical protein [Nocardioides sp. cx-169]MCD4534161.1 hypothetical protein [Nocardioides sp. cx-169]